MKYTIALLLIFLTFSSAAKAEDLDVLFGRIKEFVAAKNYSKALEEVQWVQKEIQKMNSSQVQTFFPESLAGYTAGKFESTNVMGISNIERPYKQGKAAIKVSLTGGSAGGAGLGGLAALGKMAAMFGNEQGTESIRISGRTAQLTEEGSTTELTVFLDSGSMLKFESVAAVDGKGLQSFAEAFPIEALDSYLRGIAK